MADQQRAGETSHGQARLELTHHRREARTALELAVVALAPWSLIERLATAAGLLEALCELPSDSPPALTLMPKVLEVAREVLEDWRSWQKDNRGQKLPRV